VSVVLGYFVALGDNTSDYTCAAGAGWRQSPTTFLVHAYPVAARAVAQLCTGRLIRAYMVDAFGIPAMVHNIIMLYVI
jgi:hypothetical protein